MGAGDEKRSPGGASPKVGYRDGAGQALLTPRRSLSRVIGWKGLGWDGLSRAASLRVDGVLAWTKLFLLFFQSFVFVLEERH